MLDVNGFYADLQKLSMQAGNMTAVIRKHAAWIQTAIFDHGVTDAAIVDALNRNGLAIKLSTFKTAWRRICEESDIPMRRAKRVVAQSQINQNSGATALSPANSYTPARPAYAGAASPQGQQSGYGHARSFSNLPENSQAALGASAAVAGGGNNSDPLRSYVVNQSNSANGSYAAPMAPYESQFRY
ncbi:hypothetical protein [Pandoraea sp.]|uniref:hypothetical protein n=1 Tax=Pandoraea sp. TaxID=1883445 RepID=UPI0035AF0AA3